MKPFTAAALLICSICILSCASSPKAEPYYETHPTEDANEREAFSADIEGARGMMAAAGTNNKFTGNGYNGRSGSAATDYAAKRMIAHSVTIEIKGGKPEEIRDNINREVEKFMGFIVQESPSKVRLRVPVQNLDAFCEQVRKTGKVVFEQKTGSDITDAYHDDLIRLETLKTVRARYIDLLNKATKVEDMLNIEKELERINGQIELYEGRKKYSENRVAYADVLIMIGESTTLGPLGWVFYGLFKGIRWLFIWD